MERFKKLVFRVVVINVVFFFIKLTVDQKDFADNSVFANAAIFYYITAFFQFMFTWEINDWLLARQKHRGGLDLRSGLRILGVNIAILLPVTLTIYYLALFPLRGALQILCEDPLLQFRTDVLRALLLGLAVIFFNMFYHAVRQRDELKMQLEDLRKEAIESKYVSLKNQISPHFLFNSLNTLTSLLYEDRDLASDFIARLASSYRYVLENRDDDLAVLDRELKFLDSYIFMMEIRHKDAVTVHMAVEVDPNQFQLPTLSLQMLVENALKHNFFSKEQPLSIGISTIGREALAVRNNLRKRPVNPGDTGLGLKNIKKRYSFYTNKQVLVREEADYFEVILPLLDLQSSKTAILAIS